MCRVLGVSRSGYYDWCKRQEQPTPKAQRDVELGARVREVFAQSQSRYGVRRIWKELNRQGVACGRERICRLMRQAGLVAKATRRSRPKSKVSTVAHTAENVLNREFDRARGPDEVWLVDQTYLPVKGLKKWLYLSVVLDLYSRKVVGWHVSQTAMSEGPLTALREAIRVRRPPAGLLHHSDRGVQYTCHEYQKLLARNQIRRSMSRPGMCRDNAPMESFFGRLKEELDIPLFDSLSHANSALFNYIERFYNTRRLHSALEYSTPCAFERSLH